VVTAPKPTLPRAEPKPGTHTVPTTAANDERGC
jgi:hypothetical protein